MSLACLLSYHSLCLGSILLFGVGVMPVENPLIVMKMISSYLSKSRFPIFIYLGLN